jgi:hypothetical protein
LFAFVLVLIFLVAGVQLGRVLFFFVVAVVLFVTFFVAEAHQLGRVLFVILELRATEFVRALLFVDSQKFSSDPRPISSSSAFSLSQPRRFESDHKISWGNESVTLIGCQKRVVTLKAVACRRAKSNEHSYAAGEEPLAPAV